MLGEELLHRYVHRHTIVLVGESMSLVVGDHVLDIAAEVAHRDDDLVRLGLDDAGVVGALDDEQRSGDLVGREEGRLLLEPLHVLWILGIADLLVEELPRRLPVCGDRVEECQHVRDAYIRDAAGVYVRCEGQSGQRRVAAVRTAVDRDLLRIGDTLVDEVIDTVGDVVLHRKAPLLLAGVEERLAVSGRCPEVGLEDGIAAVRHVLDLGVVTPHVTRPRAAVRVDDYGKVLRLYALRNGEVAVDGKSVAGLVLDRLHLGEVFGRQVRPGPVLQFDFARLHVVEIGGAGIDVARDVTNQ